MALKLVSFSRLKTNMTASTQDVNCNSGGPPSSLISSRYDWPSTTTSFLNLPPSGDSSCIYEPVRYRCTNADFPEDRDPTIPRRISGTPLDNVHSWLLTKESDLRFSDLGFITRLFDRLTRRDRLLTSLRNVQARSCIRPMGWLPLLVGVTQYCVANIVSFFSVK